MELGRAIQAGNLPEVQRLIREGADVNQQFPELPEDAPYGNWVIRRRDFPIIVASGLSERRNGSAIVRALIEAGANVNALPPNRITAIHMAASEHNWRTMIRLLDAGADPTVRDEMNQTPLFRIIYDVNSMAVLLAAGLDPNSRGGISNSTVMELKSPYFRPHEPMMRVLRFAELSRSEFEAMIREFGAGRILAPEVSERLVNRYIQLQRNRASRRRGPALAAFNAAERARGAGTRRGGRRRRVAKTRRVKKN